MAITEEHGPLVEDLAMLIGVWRKSGPWQHIGAVQRESLRADAYEVINKVTSFMEENIYPSLGLGKVSAPSDEPDIDNPPFEPEIATAEPDVVKPPVEEKKVRRTMTPLGKRVGRSRKEEYDAKKKERARARLVRINREKLARERKKIENREAKLAKEAESKAK